MEKKTRVIGYIRVSTEGQAEEGVSLAAQREKIECYAALYDLELVAVMEDAGASARTLKRPGLQAALAALTAGEAEGLLVAKLDRLTREVAGLGYLLDKYFGKSFALFSVGEQINGRTAGGRLVLHVLMSVSQWEVEKCSERTKDSLAHLKAQGVKLGAEALGWERTQERDEHGRCKVRPVATELETIERIRVLRTEGCSLRAIARRLEEEGRPTKRGGRWCHRTIKGVLKRQSTDNQAA